MLQLAEAPPVPVQTPPWEWFRDDGFLAPPPRGFFGPQTRRKPNGFEYFPDRLATVRAAEKLEEPVKEVVLQRWYGEVQFREEGQAVVALVSDQGEERLAQCSPEILALLDQKGCGEAGNEFVFEMRRRGVEEINIVVEPRVARPMSRAEQGEYWDYLGELLSGLDLSQDEW